MIADNNNLAVVRQSFANSVICHKAHEAAAEKKEAGAKRFRTGNLVLVALILIMLVIQTVINTNFIFSFIGAGLTAAEIVLLIAQLAAGYEREVVSHKNTALKYMSLRDRYKLLILDILNGESKNEIIKRRDTLLHEYQTISDLALETTQTDYDKAMQKLKLKQDGQNAWSDKQINSLLPKELNTV